MEKKHVIRIITRAALALTVPICGQLFVKGWNWGIGEFLFAWVFFVILGLVYTFGTITITHVYAKRLYGILVVLLFAFIWIRLATG